MWRELIEKLRYLLICRKLDRDLTTEMQFHLEARAAELRGKGVPAEEAVWQARSKFGPVSRLKEDWHAAWEVLWLENLASSLWHAARAFRRNPAFAAIAVLCLALGIGANATIFSLTMEGLFSRPSCALSELSEMTTDRASSRRSLTRLRAGGRTALFDAISQAAFAMEKIPGKKAIVVLTDGHFDDAAGR